jgi:hypothetical protein
MHYVMMKSKIFRSVFLVLIAALAFLKVNAQNDNLDIGVWYIMKVAETDKDALYHHIQTIYVTVKDSTGEKKISRTFYNKQGYLIRRVDYSQSKSDSTETVINRLSPNEIVFKCKVIKGEYDAYDESCPISFLGAYWDTLSASSYSVLTKTYKKLSGKKVRVITSFNGVIKGRSDFNLMSTVKQRVKYPRGDTTRIRDTIVVTIKEKNDRGNLAIVKRSFIKGVWDPVKTAYWVYVGDSLAYHSVEEDEYDKKKRLVSHSEYLGPPLRRLVIKRTIYNDSTGERTETHGYNPVSGQPERIWRYDKKGNILYSERPGVTDIENGKIVYRREKGTSVYKYNQKGLLEEVVWSTDDVPTGFTYYRYTYY